MKKFDKNERRKMRMRRKNDLKEKLRKKDFQKFLIKPTKHCDTNFRNFLFISVLMWGNFSSLKY